MEYAGIDTTSRNHTHKFFSVMLAAILLLTGCATPLEPDQQPKSFSLSLESCAPQIFPGRTVALG